VKAEGKQSATMDWIKKQIGYFLHISLCIIISQQQQQHFVSGTKSVMFMLSFPSNLCFFGGGQGREREIYVINFRPFTFILCCIVSIIDFLLYFSTLSKLIVCVLDLLLLFHACLLVQKAKYMKSIREIYKRKYWQSCG